MRRILFPVLGALVALVLAGCTITIDPVIPPNAVKVTANENPNAPVHTDSLAAGSAEIFEITVPQTVQSGYDVVYVELGPDMDIELELRAANYASVLMSSNSRDYFGRFSTGLAAVSADLDAQGITSMVNCRGSCVIFQPTASTYYARVKNDSGVGVSYDLYVYGDDLQDDTEPNGAVATAAPFAVASTVSGAIETIGDRDLWDVIGDATIQLDTAAGNPVDIEATVLNSAGVAIDGPYGPGAQFQVFDGEYVRVESASDFAAASAKSVYYLGAP
ncbi:MAG: hypothetical protein R6W77_06195 [Trueperaceae bacterium]